MPNEGWVVGSGIKVRIARTMNQIWVKVYELWSGEKRICHSRSPGGNAGTIEEAVCNLCSPKVPSGYVWVSIKKVPVLLEDETSRAVNFVCAGRYVVTRTCTKIRWKFVLGWRGVCT
jgi:hypothetical protein